MNPFGINYNPDYFCDRENETLLLKRNIENGLNTLLHSPRRMGKSTLIYHLFFQLEKEKQYEVLYIDLFSTRNMGDLVTLLAEKILQKFHKKNFILGISKLLKGLSPTVSFSPDGTPILGLNIQESQQKQTLGDLLNYLENQKKPVVVAFDEFQEVATYPEKAEALLRTYIQQLKNVRFIYSGSSNHLLKEMFYSAKRPFYQSSEVLVLDKLNYPVYKDFISSAFSKNGKTIDEGAVEFILDFSESYTYYTQICCNQCFSKADNHLTRDDVVAYLEEYIDSRKADYYQLYSLLPENQKKVVAAIALEGEVAQPTAFDFIMKHKLPAGSSTLQAVNSLADKEIIYSRSGSYIVYDLFFKQFLIRFSR